jgi:hypothetical protein
VTIGSPDTTELGDGMLPQSDGSWSLTEAFSAGHLVIGIALLLAGAGALFLARRSRGVLQA